ncbi:MAG TPA: hypothetical protein VM554_09280 [Acidisarcina sp.]|nr:hypothetical protein [Acidisarcina sp.]
MLYTSLSGNLCKETEKLVDYQQLVRHYSSMYDEELQTLAAQYDDLTEVAQQALREELQRRKMDLPQRRQEPSGEVPAAVPLEVDMAADGNALVGNFRTVEEATIAYWALEIAGIASKVVTPQTPRLQLAPEDVERAQQVLAQPISDEAMEQYEAARETGDFQSPECPRCGTPDPLLESADPVNEWFCESCGHQWKDTLHHGTE